MDDRAAAVNSQAFEARSVSYGLVSSLPPFEMTAPVNLFSIFLYLHFGHLPAIQMQAKYYTLF